MGQSAYSTQPVQRLITKMATSTIHYISVVFIISLISGSTVNAVQELIQSTNTFTADLYQAIRHYPGNIVVSPMSLHVVLGMALQGAKGTTALEMAKVLRLSENNEEYIEKYKSLIADLDVPVFKLASRIYIEKSLPILPDFQSVLTQFFLAEAETSDFLRNPEESRLEINRWVEQKTKLKIKNLLPSGSVDYTTQLVLVNAVHFKSEWKVKFNKKKTIEEPFFIKPNVSVNVKMMQLFDEPFPYMWHEDLEAEIVEIPYRETDFKMVIILPDKQDGLSKVESKFASLNVIDMLSNLEEQKIDISFPKFKIRKAFDMVEPLKEMGMSLAFTKAADFSGISNTTLSVSKVMQKAFLVVNERGSEAAAASGLAFTARVMNLHFNCNKPFMYLIMKRDIILFVGRFSKP